jgi:hypothetical protein
MKNDFQITLKDKSAFTLGVFVKTNHETAIKVGALLEQNDSPLFSSIEHKHLNPLLELSKNSFKRCY